MTGSYLVDTNILVYAYDRSEPEKMTASAKLLDRLALSGRGTLSLQVLAEFFVVVTRKLPQPMPVALAEKRILNYLQGWRTVSVTTMVFREAIRGVREHGMAYWDAQIWATARLNQIPTILSENFSHGATVEEVHFLNPFDPSFDPSL
jgi:predicted nucleic acid-binding protein